MSSGRQRKQIQDAIFQSLENGVSVASACRSAGVSRQTFYDWMENEKFRARVERIRSDLIRSVESVALACALKAEDDPRYQATLKMWLVSNAGWSAQSVEPEIGDLRDERNEILRRIGGIVARVAETGGVAGNTDS